MATSIFHGITKSNLRTFCRRLDAYMIIIYTSAKTPQNLTRFSLSLFLSFSPSHFIFLSGVQHIIGSFPFLLPSPFNTTTRTTRTAAATFVFVLVFVVLFFKSKMGDDDDDGWKWTQESSLKLQHR
jgi:hypothetical protein